MTGHDDIAEHARRLLRQYGDAAFLHAAMKADAALIDNDEEQHRLWTRITRLIGEIERIGEGSTTQ